MSNDPNDPTTPPQTPDPQPEETTNPPAATTTSSNSDPLGTFNRKAGEVWLKAKPRLRRAGEGIRGFFQITWTHLCAWWRALPRLAKVLVAVVALIPMVWHFVQKKRNEPFEMQITRPGTVPYDIYLVDVNEVNADEKKQPIDHLRLSEATLLRPFGVVIRFYNLMPNRAYQITASVEDSKGAVLQGPGPVNIDSKDGTSWAYFAFYPRIDTHAAGQWKATLHVSNVGDLTHDFTVKDLSQEEKDYLAAHEEAREEALRAFAFVWAVVPHQKIKAYATAVEDSGERSSPLKRFRLLQVAGLDYKMEQLHISSADRLNGITYRGIARFGFTVFRGYDPTDGWTEWIDVRRPENQMLAPLLEAWQQMADSLNVPFNPDNIQPAPHMLFQIEKRDGQWWTVSQEGMRFVNGSRAGTGQGAFIQPPKGMEERQLLKAEKFFQPTIEAVAEISDDGATERKRLEGLSQKLKASPDVLKKQQKDTVESLK